LTGERVLKAFSLQWRFKIAYCDAAMVAAAQEMGCTTLFSEDLKAGQNYAAVTVRNPFTDA
jgi:predicted nucleic acid-binding protein